MHRIVALVAVVLLAFGAAPATAQSEGSGTILGTVTDAVSGVPVEGITVAARTDLEGYISDVARTTTDADGSYRLEVRDASSYSRLWVAFLDERGIEFPYAETYYRNETSGALVHVEAGETVEGVDGRLMRSGELEGRLVDAASGAPVEGARVRVLPGGLCCIDEFAVSDADGRYRFTGLLPGRYSVVAADSAFAYQPDPSTLAYVERWSGGVDRALEAELVDVGPQQRVALQDLALDRTGTLAGRATGAIREAPVCARAYDERHRARLDPFFGGYVDPDTGSWRIDGLSPGSYRVEYRRCDEYAVSQDPAAVAAPIWHGDAATFEAARPITLSPGEVRDDLVQEVAAGGAMAGRVLDPGGGGLVSACVTAVDDAGRGSAVTSSEPDGGFALLGLPPGAYRVLVSDGCAEADAPFGRPFYAPVWAGGAGAADAARVEVVRGRTAQVGEVRMVGEAGAVDVALGGPGGTFHLDACAGLIGTGFDRPPTASGPVPGFKGIDPGPVTVVATDCNVDAATSPQPASLEVEVVAGASVAARFELPERVERLEGPTRIETAARLSGERGSAQSVVLARADAYPDALAGAPLAALVDGPLLLTGTEGLAVAVRSELDRLRPEVAYLLGGTAALSPAIESELESRGIRVERLAGRDRFETAGLVAEQLAPTTDGAYVVEGASPDPARGWPDAVAVAGLAAAEGRAVLLVTRDQLPDATRRALEEVAEATVVGGTSAVSIEVESQVAGLVDRVDRVAGATRYDTSAALAARGGPAGLDPARAWLATGANWPDALAAGPAAAADGAPLLLVDGADPSGSTATLERLGPDSTRVVLVGSDDVLSRRVEAAVRDRLRDAAVRCSEPLALLVRDRLPCVEVAPPGR